ncbi:polysaccharide deacetylase family protein [Virgibacillus xinjiangensis]|uniref:Polysaccharide deacetylase family protein n=1 Tax=Virgibacillus xinjiangensis TaxID=393090 RepID=A0ABV7CVK0_9BACI
MRHLSKAVHLLVFIIIVALAFDINHNPFFVSEFPAISTSMSAEDPLYQEIQEKSRELAEKPQDAYIDQVWHKTPGRNGLEVDIQASYEKMKEKGSYDEALLEYKQIPPATKLKDLPASPIYRGHPDKEMVAFLINVSWGTEHIPDILRVLKENNVKATFFIEGKWAKENAGYVKMIHEQGHVVGNHAYNHPDMRKLSSGDIAEQISRTNDIIKATIGISPEWFAPPSGNYTDEVVRTAHQMEMETILWTVDTIDWKNPSVSVMINRVNDRIHRGATILMHPTPAIVEGLEPLIKNIKGRGYKIDTIDKLLREER